MTHTEIRDKFLDFFRSRGHTVVPSSSLLPDDPSVLFTSAGMQQFKPFYTSPELAPSKNVASIQKCVRTGDIDEVGDASHFTFFEMLGNFSFGGYFKREAIAYAHEFITSELGLTIDYVTVFAGEEGIPEDAESEDIWKSLDPSLTIRKVGGTDNFWGPTGDEGPCGPTTEIYVNGIEIWNIVFNQYFRKKDSTLGPLATPGIDTGMGLERLVMAVQKVPTCFETDLFASLIALVPADAGDRARRIIADHIRSSVFMIADGVRPSNKDQGYVLRRLLRRLSIQLSNCGVDVGPLISKVIDIYGDAYPFTLGEITAVIGTEDAKFQKTLTQGKKELARLEVIDADSAFKLYESFGLPYEAIKDLGGDTASTLTREKFDAKFKEHQDKSRAGATAKFGGHGLLLDTGELKAADEAELKVVTRLHTATHLLHAALRKVLGEEVHQAGSDITAERTRFDFTYPRKLTAAELKSIENMVNDVIARDMPMTKVTLPKDEAEKTGALHFFKIKYPAMVDVYTIGDPGGDWFSKEFCGGPHVSRIGEIGPIRIAKEEAVSAGVRRIRAVLTT